MLGTRDYVRKCGFERVIIGLSGGIDSALTAAIAAEALGPENVIGVGMPGPYSSPGSIDDARALAANLGIRFELLCITEIFESYRKTLQKVFAGCKEDTTEENIQSRTRGCAADGAFQQVWRDRSQHRQQKRTGSGILHPVRGHGRRIGGDLRCAEDAGLPVEPLREFAEPGHSRGHPGEAAFRRAASGQKDSDTLPPYDVLDAILEDYVEDSHSAEQIAADRGFDLELVKSVMRMVDRAEYKRQQAAPD